MGSAAARHADEEDEQDEEAEVEVAEYEDEAMHVVETGAPWAFVLVLAGIRGRDGCEIEKGTSAGREESESKGDKWWEM